MKEWRRGEGNDRRMDKPHRKLDVWKVSMALVVRIYELSNRFPFDQRYRLNEQIQRSAISIPSIIAEGAAPQTRREFANFLHMAQGSVSELDTQLEIARRLGYCADDDWTALDRDLERIDRMLSGLIRRQRRLSGPQHPVRRSSPPASRLPPSDPSSV